MNRAGRLVALASVAALLLAGGAFVLSGQAPARDAGAPVSAMHVTLYQNGLAFVEQDIAFTSRGDATPLSFSVPSSTRIGSLAFDGDGNVTVSRLRAPLHGSGMLQPGDRLVVHAQDGGPFEGTLLRDDGNLLLAGGDGTVTIPRDKIVAIEMVSGAGGNATAPGQVAVQAHLEAPAGTHRVRVSYLAQGAGWTPSYRLDLDTGRLDLFATLTGLQGWRDVTLDLISGTPHLAPGADGPRPLPMMLEARGVMAADAAAGASGFAPSEPLGPLHRFRYGERVDLPAGEQVRLLVAGGAVDLAPPRHEVEAFVSPGGYGDPTQTLPVRERIELTNALNETLPSGALLAYRGGAWVGEDRLAAAPPGGRANVTLAFVEDVTARLVREDASLANGSSRETFALHVENRGDSPAQVRASLAYPTERTRLASATPPPDERLGGQVVWEDSLAAGAAAAYRATLDTQREAPAMPMPVPMEGGAEPSMRKRMG